MVVLSVICGVLAFGAWLSAVVHAAWALAHRNGKYSLAQMFFGARCFDEENYTPRGQQLQRRFVRSMVLFFSCAVVVVALNALAPTH